MLFFKYFQKGFSKAYGRRQKKGPGTAARRPAFSKGKSSRKKARDFFFLKGIDKFISSW